MHSSRWWCRALLPSMYQSPPPQVVNQRPNPNRPDKLDGLGTPAVYGPHLFHLHVGLRQPAAVGHHGSSGAGWEEEVGVLRQQGRLNRLGSDMSLVQVWSNQPSDQRT